MAEFKVQLHGRLHHQFRLQQVRSIADARYDRITSESALIANLPARVQAVLDANASIRSKMTKLEALGNEIAQAIAPHAGCRRHCSSCCNISVSVSTMEAERIGQKINRAPYKIPHQSELEALQSEYFGVPCPFLSDGSCSIYEHRPLACRLHFTLDVDNYFCGIDLDPSSTLVPNVDLTPFWIGYGVLAIQARGSMGDFRQFFPS